MAEHRDTLDVIRPSRADWILFAAVGTMLLVSLWLAYRPVNFALHGRVIAVSGAMDAYAALSAPTTLQDGRRGTLPFGVVRWLRYDLSASDEPQVLIAQPSTLDTIDLTLFTPDGAVVLAARLGDRHERPEESVIALRTNLLLPPHPEGGTLIARVETRGMNAVMLSVVPAIRFAQSDALGWLGLAVFFGGRLLLLLLSVMEARTHRQAVWGWFAAQNLASVAFALGSSGALRILLPNVTEPWIDDLSSYGVIGYTATSFLFHGYMLALFVAPRWMMRVALAGSALPIAALALHLVGAGAAALMLNSFSIVVFGVLVLVSAGMIRSGAGAPITLVRLALGAVGSGTLAQALAIVGWAPMSQISIQGGTLTPVFAGVLALWLLMHRAERQRRALARSEQRLALAEQRAVLDRESRLAADRFIGVLAHTIRTPLSLIRLVLEDPAAGARAGELARLAVRDVDGVLERCVQLARLELGETPIRRAPTDVAAAVASAVAWTRLGDRAVREGPEGRANVDAHALGSILFELLDNAARYAPEGSRVDVGWAFGATALTLRVDSRIGRLGTVDPAQVFDRYARGEKAHAVTGAGLGLHLVQTLAALHGGEARFTSDGAFVRVEVSLTC